MIDLKPDILLELQSRLANKKNEEDTDETSSQIIDQQKIKDMNEEGEMIEVRIEKQEPIFSHMKPEVLLELQSMLANKKNEQSTDEISSQIIDQQKIQDMNEEGEIIEV